MRRRDAAPLSAEDRAELVELHRYLEARLAPGSRRGIIAPLARIANHHKQDRSPEEWQMLFDDYAADLGEFSDGVVEQAIIEHRRASNWFPKVAELRIRCLEIRELDRIRLDRCKRAIAA